MIKKAMKRASSEVSLLSLLPLIVFAVQAPWLAEVLVAKMRMVNMGTGRTGHHYQAEMLALLSIADGVLVPVSTMTI